MKTSSEVMELVSTRGRIVAREFCEDTAIVIGHELSGKFTEFEFLDASVIRITGENFTEEN